MLYDYINIVRHQINNFVEDGGGGVRKQNIDH